MLSTPRAYFLLIQTIRRSSVARNVPRHPAAPCEGDYCCDEGMENPPPLPLASPRGAHPWRKISMTRSSEVAESSSSWGGGNDEGAAASWKGRGVRRHLPPLARSYTDWWDPCRKDRERLEIKPQCIIRSHIFLRWKFSKISSPKITSKLLTNKTYM